MGGKQVQAGREVEANREEMQERTGETKAHLSRGETEPIALV